MAHTVISVGLFYGAENLTILVSALIYQMTVWLSVWLRGKEQVISNFPYLRFLGLASDSGYWWVELCVQAGMDAALLLRVTDIGFGYEHILPINFGVLSSCDKPAVEEMLLASIAKLGVNSDPALVTNVSYHTAIDHPLYSEAADMVTLRVIMQRIIDSGVSPEKITNLLAAHFLK